MRKMRNQEDYANPALTFAQAVEQIVSEKIAHPTQYKDYELETLTRKEQQQNLGKSKHRRSCGFNFVEFLKSFVWTNRGVHH
ncbi:MAG: hypothetical protein P8Y12_03985 [Gammaproteobacteria bacterium]